MTWKTDRTCVRVLEVVLQCKLHKRECIAGAELLSGRPAISRAYVSNAAQSLLCKHRPACFAMKNKSNFAHTSALFFMTMVQ